MAAFDHASIVAIETFFLIKNPFLCVASEPSGTTNGWMAVRIARRRGL